MGAVISILLKLITLKPIIVGGIKAAKTAYKAIKAIRGIFPILILALVAAGCDEAPARPTVEVIQFGSVSCAPCRVARTVIVQTRLRVSYTYVDVDVRPDLAKQYGVTSIPLFVVLVDGQPEYRTHNVHDIVRAYRG